MEVYEGTMNSDNTDKIQFRSLNSENIKLYDNLCIKCKSTEHFVSCQLNEPWKAYLVDSDLNVTLFYYEIIILEGGPSKYVFFYYFF